MPDAIHPANPDNRSQAKQSDLATKVAERAVSIEARVANKAPAHKKKPFPMTPLSWTVCTATGWRCMVIMVARPCGHGKNASDETCSLLFSLFERDNQGHRQTSKVDMKVGGSKMTNMRRHSINSRMVIVAPMLKWSGK